MNLRSTPGITAHIQKRGIPLKHFQQKKKVTVPTNTKVQRKKNHILRRNTKQNTNQMQRKALKNPSLDIV